MCFSSEAWQSSEKKRLNIHASCLVDGSANVKPFRNHTFDLEIISV